MKKRKLVMKKLPCYKINIFDFIPILVIFAMSYRVW